MSFDEEPESSLVSRSGASTGELGADVSIVTDSAAEASEVFPDKSVEVDVTEYVPSARVVAV